MGLFHFISKRCYTLGWNAISYTGKGNNTSFFSFYFSGIFQLVKLISKETEFFWQCLSCHSKPGGYKLAVRWNFACWSYLNLAGLVDYSFSLVTEQISPAAHLPLIFFLRKEGRKKEKEKKRKSRLSPCSGKSPAVLGFQLSVGWIPLQALSHPEGQMRRHVLSFQANVTTCDGTPIWACWVWFCTDFSQLMTGHMTQGHSEIWLRVVRS